MTVCRVHAHSSTHVSPRNERAFTSHCLMRFPMLVSYRHSVGRCGPSATFDATCHLQARVTRCPTHLQLLGPGPGTPPCRLDCSALGPCLAPTRPPPTGTDTLSAWEGGLGGVCAVTVPDTSRGHPVGTVCQRRRWPPVVHARLPIPPSVTGQQGPIVPLGRCCRGWRNTRSPTHPFARCGSPWVAHYPFRRLGTPGL